jgi:hypothetical protein
MLSRFKKLAESKGFKLVPVGCFINGTFTRRPDLLSVQYKKRHIMTIPTRILGFPSETHCNLTGQMNPDYFHLEHQLRSWNQIIKTTNYLNEKLYK